MGRIFLLLGLARLPIAPGLIFLLRWNLNFKKVILDALLVFLLNLIASEIGAYIFYRLGDTANPLLVPIVISMPVLLISLIYVGITTVQGRFMHLLLVSFAVFFFKLPAIIKGFPDVMDMDVRIKIIVSSALLPFLWTLISYGFALVWLRIFRKKPAGDGRE